MCPAAEEEQLTSEAPPRVALVVDHDDDDGRWVAAVLGGSGFRVHRADSAASALPLADLLSPDLVVIEARLDQGADGVEVVRRLRARSSTFIVLHSADDSEIDIVRGLSAGADAFLLRPLSSRELKVRIAAVMRRPRSRLGAARPRTAPAVPEPAAPEVVAASEPAVSELVAPEPVESEVAASEVVAPEVAVSELAVSELVASEPVATEAPVRVMFRGGWIEYDVLRLHPDDGIFLVDEQPVTLNPRSFDLMEVMLYAEGETRTPADLAIAIHDDADAAADLETVVLLMEALRQLLARVAPQREWIARTPDGYLLGGAPHA